MNKLFLFTLIFIILFSTIVLAWDQSTCDKIIWAEGNDCPNGEPVVYNGQNYYCTTSCGYYGAENGEVICLCMKTFPYLLGD